MTTTTKKKKMMMSIKMKRTPGRSIIMMAGAANRPIIV